jgi:hypothetical protein
MRRIVARFSFALIAFLGLLQTGFSRDYYLNSNIGADGSNGSKNSPWKTLEPLSRLVFNGGDKVFFAKGSRFTGGFMVKGSGTKSQPILFTTYGSGAAPVFTNPDYEALNGNVFQVHGNYITINGLHFAHTASCTYNEPVKAEEYWKNEELRTRIDKKVLLVGAVYQVEGASNLTVSGCEFEDCPIAVYINGQQNIVTGNNFHDCNRTLWDLLWGPIALVIANAYNEVSYNRCSNYKREGGTFGADGGFIELDSRYYGGPIHDVNVHHNYSTANEGFMEITNSGSHLNVLYNVSDDFQQFIFFWEGDSSRIENNTVIRTRPSNSSVNVVFTFKHNGFVVRNNIFVLTDSLQVFAGGAYDARNFNQLHENNIYHVAGKSSVDPVGKPLGKGEIIADPKLVNWKGHDFRLLPGSPAIDAGQQLGYKKDFEDKPVPAGAKPDIGAFEFRPSREKTKAQTATK